MNKKAKLLLLTGLLSALGATAITIPVSILSGLTPLVVERLGRTVTEKVLLCILMMLVILIIGLTIYILLLRGRLRLRPGFGIYWDKGLNPHCPACETLLTSHCDFETYCLKCGHALRIKNDDGKELSLKEARTVLGNA